MPKLEVAGGSLLLRACLRAGDLDFALDVLRAHRQLRSALSKSVCLDLLAALSKEGRTDEMLDAFSYMRAAQPGVACPKALGIIGAGLGRKGLAAQATQVLLQVPCLAPVCAGSGSLQLLHDFSPPAHACMHMQTKTIFACSQISFGAVPLLALPKRG